jgi:hypothetical protein
MARRHGYAVLAAITSACLVFAACVSLDGLQEGASSGSPEGDGASVDGPGSPEGSTDGSADGGNPVDDSGFPRGDAACPVPLDAGPDGAPNITLLAVGETSPVRITTDYASVFWIAGVPVGSAAIRACAAGGCNGVPTTLTQFDRAYGFLTVDDTNLYYTDGYTPGTVWKCPKTGCTDASAIVSSLYAPNGITTDGADVYWVASISGDISTCKAPGCASVTPLVTGEAQPRRIAVDATSLYWTSKMLIRACERADCSGTLRSLAGMQATPGEGAIALSPTTVFWANGGVSPWTINACSKAGCNLTPTTVVPGLTSAPVDIVVDGANLYWIDLDSLKTCPVSGCSAPQTVVAGLFNPQSLALDARQGCANALYWAEGDGSVKKLVP